MKRGFTLVELLVVITIFVTILGFGLASFNRFNRRERLKQVALTLKSNLRFAQTKAISAQKPSSGCSTYVGMRVSFTNSTYSMQHECTPEGVVGAVESVTFPSAITFSPIPSDFTIMTLTNRVDLSSDETLSLTNGSQTYALVISWSGNIRDLGFQ